MPIGDVAADVAAVGIDLMRTVGIADGGRVLCGEVPVGLGLSAGSVLVWTEAVHAMPWLGSKLRAWSEIVGAQLLENGV